MPILLVVAIIAGLVTIQPLVRYLERSRTLDIPNERSSHVEPVPVGGGLCILGVWITGMVIAAASGIFCAANLPASLAAGAVSLGVLGYFDDRRGLPPLTRLAVQALVTAVCLRLCELPVIALELPGLQPTSCGSAGWFLAWIFVVGFTNMFNFMDGIDGLAGFQVLLGAAALAVWATLAGDASLAVIDALLACSTIGFLRANFPRALVFMGDVGSLPLGFLLAMSVLRLHVGPEARGETPFWLSILFVWPFLSDATFTLINRAVHGRNPFRAHRSHIYQRLVVAGWSHRRVTLHYATAMAACIAVAFACRAKPALGPYALGSVTIITLTIALTAASSVRATATTRHGNTD